MEKRISNASRVIEQSHLNIIDLISVSARNKESIDLDKAVILYAEIVTNLLRKRQNLRVRRELCSEPNGACKYTIKTFTFNNFIKKYKIHTGFGTKGARNCGKKESDSLHHIKYFNHLQNDMLHLMEFVELDDSMKFIVIKELVSIYEGRNGLSAPKVVRLERELFGKSIDNK